MEEILELWTAGGIFLYPITVLSFISVFMSIDRYFVISKQKQYDKFAVLTFFESKNITGCMSYVSTHSSIFHQIIKQICHISMTTEVLERDVLKKRCEELGKEHFSALENNMVWIGLVANIAPMIGLMGTVWGMILTFKAIESVGLGSISGLAGGISQALITTLAGLLVGIPSLMMYRLLDRKLDTLSIEMERDILECIDVLVHPENQKILQQEELAQEFK